MPLKRTFIKDITPGHPVQDIFVISEARQGQTRNGDPYWNLLLSDKSGKTDAKIWPPLSQSFTDLAPGQIVRIGAQADTYRDKTQLVIGELTVLNGDLEHEDMKALLPVSETAPEELYTELEDLLREHIRHKPWKNFVFRVLGNEEIKARLLAAPGAKTIHHAYAGGLLEHTLAVCKVSLALAGIYPGLDREVLLIAAAFHDIGKAWELTGGLTSDFTDEGRLLGHIHLGLEILDPFLKKAKGLEPGLVTHFKHLILSHHGELEYGSPKRPKTQEALVLHFADQFDSKLNTARGAFEEEAGPGAWSPYVRSLERFLYKPETTPAQNYGKKQATKEPAQCLLPLKG